MGDRKDKQTLTFARYSPPGLSGIVSGIVEVNGFSEYTRNRLYPRNTPEILINLGDPLYATYKDRNPTLRTYMMQGSKTSYASVTHPEYRHFISIRFTPNGFYKLWKVPQKEFTDRFYLLDDVLEEVDHLVPSLCSAGSRSDRFSVLTRWLKREFLKSGQKQQFLSDYIISQLQKYPRKTVRELVRETGYSRKHLSCRFKEEAGLTIKTFQKIARAYRVMKEIRHGECDSWLMLAFDYGYYDQSHFIKDFKRFTGFTPTEFSGNLGRTPSQ